MTARPAAGGGRWVSVAPERLAGWIRGFEERHGPFEAAATALVVRLTAADGSAAECHVPFPPLTLAADPDGGGGSPGGAVDGLVVHATRPRTVGVLLVRLGGYAAGVFEGQRLVASKVGSRLVHGRSAAGGWSQQRFARRREKQSAEALRAAADVAARVLVPRAGEMDAAVFGGDRRAVDELRADRRLAPIFSLEEGVFLPVPDPKLAVLEDAPRQFRAVRIRVLDAGA
ncbi:hypothetical protein Pth03_00920 [Planotetraspora thailandica]|uniref:Actinobacteria/chloroflexi VLRF1 release factor domain-containing protein n=1 Tax=Planotetraspora thailandica TaxID=487172 RepID=A0A8J3UTD4_9ACTN|nr:acVLRF1 family peptidyl-tRNA hydrolase [Planotetraspora thailandica]GII51703.1 hypothetical protein Pth03_00920 [Planotetraspora thailandica]